MYNIIRYPGSKAKLWREIIRRSPPAANFGGMFAGHITCYAEPFFGSGAIGQRVLSALASNPSAKIILNDIDLWLVQLWRSVHNDSEGLIRRIEGSPPPTAQDFYDFKAQDGDPNLDPVEAGFRKLVLHRASFSGLGAMAGGPLGGRNQKSAYKASCRWTPQTICTSVSRARRLFQTFRGVSFFNDDFETLLGRVPQTSSAFVYLDPPYYGQGPALYKHSFSEADHIRLATVLKRSAFSWVLSYDDCPFIESLYGWANVVRFSMTPTTSTAKTVRRKNNELIISNHSN